MFLIFIKLPLSTYLSEALVLALASIKVYLGSELLVPGPVHLFRTEANLFV